MSVSAALLGRRGSLPAVVLRSNTAPSVMHWGQRGGAFDLDGCALKVLGDWESHGLARPGLRLGGAGKSDNGLTEEWGVWKPFPVIRVCVLTFAICRAACAAKRAEGVGQQRAVRWHAGAGSTVNVRG